MVLVFGFAEKAGDTVYNSAAVIDSDGRWLGVRRKNPLYPYPYETDSFSEPPRELRSAVFDTSVGRIGVSVCASMANSLRVYGRCGWTEPRCSSGSTLPWAADGSVRVWDAHTGMQLVELASSDSVITNASFSEGGKAILTRHEDESTHVWRAAPWRTEDLPELNRPLEEGEDEFLDRYNLWVDQAYPVVEKAPIPESPAL